MILSEFPKILFIADEIPQSINAGSIQFFRLFKDYPTDKLMVVGREPSANAEILQCEYHKLKFTLLDRLRTSKFSSYLINIQSLGFFLPSLPRHIKKIADEFKPDIVVSLMQLITFYYPAYHYAKEKKIPFVIFCHDDVEDFAKPHLFFRQHLIKLNAKIYKSASKRLCISPEMAKAWEIKYQAEGDYLYPIASENILGRNILKCETLVNENHLTIGYAGSLAYGYGEGINELIPALEQTNTKLIIYRDYDEKIISSDAIKFAGFAKTPEETWTRIKKECDTVILPYSYHAKFKSLYETHFPSKIPEYLALSLPITIYGPSYATGVRWAFDNLGISQLNYKTIASHFRNLKNSSSSRRECILKNESIFDFKKHIIIEKFHMIINETLKKEK